MIETLQGYYVDLDPFRHEARVVNQVAKEGDGTSITLKRISLTLRMNMLRWPNVSSGLNKHRG